MENERIKRYIYSQIQNGEFTFLPSTISSGVIYKIPSHYNLIEYDFEIAYLYLRKESYIFSHEHKVDIERYKKIDGILRVNNEIVAENICRRGENHGIDPVPTDTIIETCKIKKEYLTENNITDINSETFDKVLRKSILKR